MLRKIWKPWIILSVVIVLAAIVLCTANYLTPKFTCVVTHGQVYTVHKGDAVFGDVFIKEDDGSVSLISAEADCAVVFLKKETTITPAGRLVYIYKANEISYKALLGYKLDDYSAFSVNSIVVGTDMKYSDDDMTTRAGMLLF